MLSAHHNVGDPGHDDDHNLLDSAIASLQTQLGILQTVPAISGQSSKVLSNNGAVLQWINQTGAQGTQGTQGTQGVAGPVGPQGTAGLLGPQGPQGTGGNAGSQGGTGAQGAQGATGGPQGPQGPQGDIGPTGVGTMGFTGPGGPQGVTGAQGAQGATGATGPQGTTGAAGPQGTQGTTGAAGASSVLKTNRYAPGTVATYTTTSSTLVAVDSTNMQTGSFVAPASGQVWVEVAFLLLGNTAGSGAAASVALFDHGTTSQRGDTWWINIDTIGQLPMVAKFLVTGLTSGNSYNFDLAWAQAGSITITSRALAITGAGSGNNAGPALFEVRTA